MNRTTKTALMICPLALFVHQAIYAANNSLDTITVTGSAESKAQQGKDDVYLKDQVTEYKSKKEIEAYRGNSVGDLLSGFSGTYSGDVRNGGAIDPIIRGSWGQGRIPVLVDGTEQAITVWRGFAGVSNRNYLDPFLISGVTVEKGAVLDRSLRSGSAGTVRMNTLEVDDIVKAGKKWGVEIKTEAGTNSTHGLQNKYQFGTDYRSIPDGLESLLDEYRMFFAKSDRITARNGSRLNPKNDKAVRIAAAIKEDKFEGVIAYAYRDKGNYYAGKHGAHKYGENVTFDKVKEAQDADNFRKLLKSDDPFVPLIGRIYTKGYEVPNTSYHSESWLGKAKFKFNDEANLKIGLRHSNIRYGDIMPSRLLTTFEQVGTLIQWPEATVKQTALNLDFAYNPKDNKWINLQLGAWMVRNNANTNTSGASPGDVLMQDFKYKKKIEDELPNNLIVGSKEFYEEMWKVINRYNSQNDKTPNLFGLFNMLPAQVQYSRDNYWGLTASNRMEIHPRFTLDVMANYRRETLDSTNAYEQLTRYPIDRNNQVDERICLRDNPDTCYKPTEMHSGSRKGKRNEFNAGFNFTYRPTDWLMLTAGLRYTYYKSIDKGLQEKISRGDKLRYIDKYTFAIEKRTPDTRWNDATIKAHKWESTNPPPYDWIAEPELSDDPDNPVDAYFRTREEYNTELQGYRDALNAQTDFTIDDLEKQRNFSSDGYFTEKTAVEWKHHDDGYFYSEDNPLFDGRITKEMIDEKFFNPFKKKMEKKYRIYSAEAHLASYDSEKIKKFIQPHKNHAWAPAFSATIFLTDNARIYARYTETKRMPSIFEDTVGYSTNSVANIFDRKPEHTKNLELGYVQDLRGVFPSLRRADFRLNYFRNITKNIYDRQWERNSFTLKQFNKRILEGIEFQARIDQGNIFGDLSFTYNLKNKLCDKNQAYLDTYGHNLGYINDYLVGNANSLKIYPECVNGGNASGYLKNTILPKYSIVTNLGIRLLEERLEMATRLTYHTNVKETRNRSIRDAGFYSERSDNPRWQPVFLVDAYINYKYSDNLTLSFAGTNLTDRYYMDPFTRSSMPAPGRTFKFGLTMNF